MSIYNITNLKTRISQFIKENFSQAITGQILQGILHDIVDSVIKAITAANVSFVHPIYQNIQDALTALFTFRDGPGFKYIIARNQSAPFNIVIPYDSDLISVDFRFVSGTPVVKIGTDIGYNDILEETEVTYRYKHEYTKYFQATRPIYISVTGGTVHCNVIYYHKLWENAEQRTFDSTFDQTFS